MVMRRLPDALAEPDAASPEQGPSNPLFQTGKLVSLWHRVRALFLFWAKRIWQFILEAKGMRHSATVSYRIQKIFKKSVPKMDALTPRDTLPGIKDEQYYLARIKVESKNLDNYNALGSYYLDRENFVEAQNVYEYLINHDPASSEYYAKAGYCKLRQNLFAEAISFYEKSLVLDSSHPNRFYNLALAHQGAGKIGLGLEAARKALVLEPGNAKYQQILEDLQQALAETEK